MTGLPAIGTGERLGRCPVRPCRDRHDGGRRLAVLVRQQRVPDPVVLALPRGGVPVGSEVALALGASLDVLVARKIGVPGHRERGVGAIAEGDEPVWDHDALTRLGLDRAQLDAVVAAERRELERRVRRYRDGRPLPPLAGRDVIVVDDGLATGVTAEAALRAVRRQQPRRLVLAVPTAAPDTAERLRAVADTVVCAIEPRGFHAVGEWYDDFTETGDDEVLELLGLLSRRRPSPGGSPGS